MFKRLYCLAFSTLCWGAPDLKTLIQNHRATPTPATKALLTTFARGHVKDQSGALAQFALGMTSFAQKDYTEAVAHLKTAQPSLPKLDDYIAFYLGAAQSELNNYPAAARELAGLRLYAGPLSPVTAKATLLEAQALIHTTAFADAIRVLRAQFESLPQPDGDFALAQAYDGRGEKAQASVLYQRVYFTQPNTPAAADAAQALERLKKAMGASYPPPMPHQMLVRGDQWLGAKQYAKAKQEFQEMAPQLGGLERDQATVRAGAADVLGGSALAAYRYLSGLHIPRSEADAERLYYMEEAARKTENDAGVTEALKDLEGRYPASMWRLKALVAAGNGYMNLHQPDKYTPLFRAVFDKFPPDNSTAYCHWKITWDAYLQRSKEAAELLREQLSHYPADTRAASALYFLGRLAEADHDAAAARAYYERLQDVFPHYYYGVLATDRLADAELASAAASPETSQWLDTVALPERPEIGNEQPTAATSAHIERAHLLIAAGFPDWAVQELRFGANTDGQRHLLAIELARSDATIALGLRHMKVLTPEYLSLTYDHAPKEFWAYLFPMPFREPLIQSAKDQKLDPYLVAGLIRQESEFNPEAVSRAHALGLTQLLPTTGKMMARQAGMAAFQTKMLFDPAVSLKLGTIYLRAQLDRWNGSIEQTLAAYNAGPGRVKQWTVGMQFREPAEFIESIPFNETREYVQSVMRNAVVYRQLYTSKDPPPMVANAVTSSNGDVPRTAAQPVKPRHAVKRKRTG